MNEFVSDSLESDIVASIPKSTLCVIFKIIIGQGMQSIDDDCIGFPGLIESVHHLAWTCLELLPGLVILGAGLAAQMLP